MIGVPFWLVLGVLLVVGAVLYLALAVCSFVIAIALVGYGLDAVFGTGETGYIVLLAALGPLAASRYSSGGGAKSCSRSSA